MRVENLQQWLREARNAEEDITEVMESGLTTEVDMEILKEAETETETETEAAVMGPLALYYWNRVVVLFQMEF